MFVKNCKRKPICSSHTSDEVSLKMYGLFWPVSMEDIGYVQIKEDRVGENHEHYYSTYIKHQIYHTLTDIWKLLGKENCKDTENQIQETSTARARRKKAKD